MLYYAEHYVLDQFKKAGLDSEFNQAIEGVNTYLDGCYYKSKNIRIDEWNPDPGEVFEIVVRAVTQVLSVGKSTLQHFMGMLEKQFPHEKIIDRVKTAGEVIAVISNSSSLITVQKGNKGDYIMVDSEYEVENIPVLTKHNIIYEPIPEHTSNRSSEHGSLILGGKINHHDKSICLKHLDRMNSIPLKLNRPLLRIMEEAPKSVFKTAMQKDQWNNYLKESYDKYIEIAQKGNTFYLNHKYDKRGRTYAQGYHVTTQGSAFKKAIVQLKETEIVPIERS